MEQVARNQCRENNATARKTQYREQAMSTYSGTHRSKQIV